MYLYKSVSGRNSKSYLVHLSCLPLAVHTGTTASPAGLRFRGVWMSMPRTQEGAPLGIVVARTLTLGWRLNCDLDSAVKRLSWAAPSRLPGFW